MGGRAAQGEGLVLRLGDAEMKLHETQAVCATPALHAQSMKGQQGRRRYRGKRGRGVDCVRG